MDGGKNMQEKEKKKYYLFYVVIDIGAYKTIIIEIWAISIEIYYIFDF